jgi:hypothetical protein
MIKDGIITLLLTLCVSSFSFSQDLQHADKIIEVYGQEWLEESEQNNPALVTLLDKYVNHGFYVKNVSEGKYSEFTPIESVPLLTKEGGAVTVQEFLQDYESTDFNPLKYKFFPGKDFQVIKLAGVNKIIYILPQDSILLK